jgi:hypothetical protein
MLLNDVPIGTYQNWFSLNKPYYKLDRLENSELILKLNLHYRIDTI